MPPAAPGGIRFWRITIAGTPTLQQPPTGILHPRLAQHIDIQITAATPALRVELAALLSDPRLRDPAGMVAANPAAALAPRTHVIADDARLISLARDIAQRGGNEAVVALTELASAAGEFSSLLLRGWAILPPDADGEDVVLAVILASRGHVVLPAGDAAALTRQEPEHGPRTFEPLRDPLTPREQEVLEHLVRGLPNKNIAQRLEISESTVKYHVSSIYVKLGAASRADAVSRAARAGLVTL